LAIHRNSVSGIKQDVDEHLHQSSFIAFDRWKIRLHFPNDLRVFLPELMFQQTDALFQKVVDVNDTEFSGLNPGKIQKVIHNLSGPIALFFNFIQNIVMGVSARMFANEHLSKAADACQRRVDFMGHAGGDESQGR